MKYLILFILSISLVSISFVTIHKKDSFDYPEKLSEFGFFKGSMSKLIPEEGIIPYELNTPLFTDYAFKIRFIKLPENEQIIYNDYEQFSFPIGTVLIKNFFYPKDFRHLDKQRQLIETRLLIHEDQGWVALPYVWNSEQTEAYLEVAGDTKFIQWKNEQGKKMETNYSVPNINQCKGCHNSNGKMVPIGPTARQLNRNNTYPEGNFNQLEYLQKKNWIELPDLGSIPIAAVWNNQETGSLDERARIYLDINCAHCHSEDGPANTTGLFLNIYQEKDIAYGIMKTPVAAGRGSGGLKYDIVPGKAGESIMIYRMESVHPGIAMPEIGRTLVHKEGVDLIKEWINNL